MKKNEVQKIERQIEGRKNITGREAEKIQRKVFNNFTVGICIVLYFVLIAFAYIFFIKENYVLVCRMLNLFSIRFSNYII